MNRLENVRDNVKSIAKNKAFRIGAAAIALSGTACIGPSEEELDNRQATSEARIISVMQGTPLATEGTQTIRVLGTAALDEAKSTAASSVPTETVKAEATDTVQAPEEDTITVTFGGTEYDCVPDTDGDFDAKVEFQGQEIAVDCEVAEGAQAPSATITVEATVTQTTEATATVTPEPTATPNLTPTPGFAIHENLSFNGGEQAEVGADCVISGDIVVNGVPFHDSNANTALVVVFNDGATVRAPWGASGVCLDGATDEQLVEFAHALNPNADVISFPDGRPQGQ